MNPEYAITHLNAQLVYIRWFRNPSTKTEEKFLSDLQQLLDESPIPLYFLSDLRYGRILGMRSIQQLSQLTQHPRWAGSTAFSQSSVSQMMVKSFRKFSSTASSRNEMHNTLEEALAFLESLQQDITSQVVWATVLA